MILNLGVYMWIPISFGLIFSNDVSQQCPAGQTFINGSCEKCPSGYYGKNCTRKCDGNTYGMKCSQMCSCSDNEKCDHVSGCVINLTTVKKEDLNVSTVTQRPTVIQRPTATQIPTATQRPAVTQKPTVSQRPTVTQRPAVTQKPAVTQGQFSIGIIAIVSSGCTAVFLIIFSIVKNVLCKNQCIGRRVNTNEAISELNEQSSALQEHSFDFQRHSIPESHYETIDESKMLDTSNIKTKENESINCNCSKSSTDSNLSNTSGVASEDIEGYLRPYSTLENNWQSEEYQNNLCIVKTKKRDKLHSVVIENNPIPNIQDQIIDGSNTKTRKEKLTVRNSQTSKSSNDSNLSVASGVASEDIEGYLYPYNTLEENWQSKEHQYNSCIVKTKKQDTLQLFVIENNAIPNLQDETIDESKKQTRKEKLAVRNSQTSNSSNDSSLSVASCVASEDIAGRLCPSI